MQTTVTVNLDDNIYKGLNRIIGQNDINKVIESLIHRYVADHDLEEAYRMMAQDEAREAEALEWAEGTIGDVSDEPR